MAHPSIKSVLIGGGTGFVGKHLAYRFRGLGADVKTISRMPGPERLSWMQLQDDGLPEKVDVVINVAGQNVMQPGRFTEGFQQNIMSSRIVTTNNLVASIIAQSPEKRPKVFIQISGVGYYPPSTAQIYTEEYRQKKSDSDEFFAKLAANWEKASEPLDKKETGVRRVVIRSGVVLGGKGGMYQQLFLPFFMGLGGPMGSGKQFMPWIHVDDLASMFIWAAGESNVSGILNGVAPQVITNGEFAKAMGRRLSRPTFIPFPEFAVKAMFGDVRATMILEGQNVMPQRPMELGFKYNYPDIDTALKNITIFK